MADGWYRFLCDVLSRVYYHRARVVGLSGRRERRCGPVLYVGLHRNGAVDGMIYKRFFPRATFLISSQLTRSWFGRVFFTGIPVTRASDRGDRTSNAAALDQCVATLVARRELFIFPEGTSDLGPRHLPFKPGVASILERALAAGADVTVVPVGIFYSSADGFRSDVTVVCGPDIETRLSSGGDDRARGSILMARITEALEALGINMRTADDLARAEQLAALVAGWPGKRYYETLKSLEAVSMPADAQAAWTRLQHAIDQGGLKTDRGVPAVSRRGFTWNAGWLALQAAATAAA
ncbi:MAG TPA: 1-acyl-sn-glycerol-3-phosphate acyltransferase, partial [Gemmatimonadaceae bacterium]|nr:1-acyl-sn-glycerol-3-phosphate acyltransferase [Gemmatimonadaceae bacterium]